MVDNFEVLLFLFPILEKERAIEVTLVRQDVVPGVNDEAFKVWVWIYLAWVVAEHELTWIFPRKPVLGLLSLGFLNILVPILVATSVLLPPMKPLDMNNVIGQILTLRYH